jgi:DNA excision repair protein ERCC-8
MVKNSGLAPRIPLLAPLQNLQPGSDLMFYPNEHEILTYELFDGKLIRRLRRSQQPQTNNPSNAPGATAAKGQRNIRDRTTSLAWRPHHVEMYSAHADGSIVTWKPRTEEEAELDEEEELERKEKEVDKKRKRGVLDEIYQGLTKKQITFGNMG